MSEHAIRSIGIALGERVLSPGELAATYGVGQSQIEAALGGMVVHATSGTRAELARDAVTRCLDRAGVSIKEVDLLISCRGRVTLRNEPPLELLLDYPTIPSVRMLGGCPVLFQSIMMARAWLRSEGSAARRALVVYAEACEDTPRIFGPVSQAAPRDIFSDAACAVLVEPGPGLALRGYGIVENAKWWSYLPGEAYSGQEMEIVRDSMEASKLALSRCLETAGFTLDEIDTFIFPNEVDLLMRFIARHLSVPIDRLVRIASAPSHAWAVDPIYNLDQLMTLGLAPGRRIVCLSRGMGVAAALALEVVGT